MSERENPTPDPATPDQLVEDAGEAQYMAEAGADSRSTAALHRQVAELGRDYLEAALAQDLEGVPSPEEREALLETFTSRHRDLLQKPARRGLLSYRLPSRPDVDFTHPNPRLKEDDDKSIKAQYQYEIERNTKDLLDAAAWLDKKAERLEGWAQLIYRNPEAAKDTKFGKLTPEVCVEIEDQKSFCDFAAERMFQEAEKIGNNSYNQEQYNLDIERHKRPRKKTNFFYETTELLDGLQAKVADLSSSDDTTVGELKQAYADMYRNNAEYWEKLRAESQQTLDSLKPQDS